MRIKTITPGCAFAALAAGCATPSELLQPPSGPAFVEPAPTPELPPYEPPIPHEAPQSDQGEKR